ncbi:MAG: cytochrome c oxidase subunit 3 [Saprospiraceae bacterium]|jgi:cytochrome c oxidase subunit 3
MAEVAEHKVDTPAGEEWNGGAEPFKASYGKLMMWYFLLSDAFTFAGFLIAYGALRFSNPSWPEPDFVFQTAPFGIEGMPLIFVTFMSFLLIISSVTMVRGVQEGHRNNTSGTAFWMLLTIIGGFGFLSCQAWEWNNLINTEGMTALTNPFSRFDEGGEYVSADDLEKAGYIKTSKVLIEDAKPEDNAPAATYYLAPGTEDTKENRFFVKRDHHQMHAAMHGAHGDDHGGDHQGEDHGATDKAGTSFDAESPYLITYNGETEAYELGAYKTAGGELKNEAFGPKAFGGLFFFITGFHGFHVFSGLAFLTIIMINVLSGLYVKRDNGHEMVEKIGLYWHFVDLVWVFVFLAFYLL